MHNKNLSKKFVDDNVSVSDYLIGMGAMFFEQTGNIRKFVTFKQDEPDHVVFVNMDRNEWTCTNPEIGGKVTDLAENFFSLPSNDETLQSIITTVRNVAMAPLPSTILFEHSKVQVPVEVSPIFDLDLLHPVYCMGISEKIAYENLKQGTYTGVRDGKEHHVLLFPNGKGGYYSLEGDKWHTVGEEGITLIGPRRDTQMLCVFTNPLDFLALKQQRQNLGMEPFFANDRFLIINGQRNMDEALRHIHANSGYYNVCCFVQNSDRGKADYEKFVDICQGSAINSSRLYRGHLTLADSLDANLRVTRNQLEKALNPQRMIAADPEKQVQKTPLELTSKRKPKVIKTVNVTLDEELTKKGFRL